MAKPDKPEDQSPAEQTGEENGPIKRPQRTDRDMADDTARGSEVTTRSQARGRG